MDCHAHEITGPAGTIHLEPKPIQVLNHLAHHPGQVCSRRQILDAVWTDQIVSEEVLTRCIWELRRALTDDARKPRFIQTVPKAGYRLLPTPRFSNGPFSGAPSPQGPPSAAPSPGQNTSTGSPSAAPPGGDRPRQKTDLVSAGARRNRRHLLILARKVERFWIDSVLGGTLPSEPLEIDSIEQPNLVDGGWDRVVESGADERFEARALDEAFEASGRALLVLGPPGAGKTTELLRLARAHLELARADPAEPIPVVLHLATWKPSTSLASWIAQELNLRYQIPVKVAAEWLEHGELSLFLDGMDEMPERYRSPWIQACNAFRQRYGLVPMLVTSRSSDYAAAARAGERLRLGSAVELQPLTRAQSLQFLARQASVPKELRSALLDDPELQQLAQSPLTLALLSRAYSGSIAGSDQLWTAYVDSMLSKTGSMPAAFTSTSGAADPPSLKRTLGWLARSMQRSQQTLLDVDLLQPDWLRTRGERWAYLLLSRGGAALAIAALAVGMRGGDPRLVGFLLPAIFLSGVFMAGLDAVRGALERRRETQAPPQKSAKRHPLKLLYPWLVWIGTGVVGVFVVRQSGNFLAATRSFFLIGLPFCLLFGVNGWRRPLARDIGNVETIRWSWSQALRGFVIGAGAAFAGISLLALWHQRNNLPPGTAIFGLGPSINLGLTAAALFGLRGRRVEERERGAVATRIRNSLLGAGTVAACLWIGFFVLERTSLNGAAGPDPSSFEQRRLEVPIFTGVIALLWFGGLDLIKQFSLRLVLKIKHDLPLKLRPLLDFLVSRAMLKPVGRGYVFRHRQLLEHLAAEGGTTSEDPQGPDVASNPQPQPSRGV
ncbi:MAG: winged helix-turn-helix domain-containing protein [Acidobacteriota bacterium]